MYLSRCIVPAAAIFALGCGAAAAGGNGGSFPGNDEARRAAASPVAEVWISPPNAELSSFNHLAVDSRGNVHLPDFYRNRVVTIGPDGHLVRTMGRRGSGPGEFQAIRTVQVLPGDSLMVFDGGLGRVSVFGPGADRPAYITTFRGSTAWWVERTRGNDAYVARYEPGFQFGQGTSAGPRQDRIRVLNLDGSERSTVLSFPARSFIVAQQSVTPNPWGQNGFVRVDSQDRLHYVRSDTLGVATYDLAARRIGGFRHDYTPPPVTRADLDHELSGVPREMLPVFRRAYEDSLPGRWPAVRAFLIDDQDRLWVELAGPLSRDPEWAAFSATGAYVGSMLVPAGTSVYNIRGSSVLAKKEDEDGAPRLVLLRMARPPR